MTVNPPQPKNDQSRRALKALAWPLCIGGLFGIALVFVQKRFHISQNSMQVFIGIAGTVVLVVCIPFIIRFYIGFGKDLGGGNHE